MPIRFAEHDKLAIFEGVCGPEDADILLDWLRRTPGDPAADARGCTGLHTAVLQVMLAAPLRVAGAPADAGLAACLSAAASEHGFETAANTKVLP